MIQLFIKGLIIGLVFGVPAGAIGALTLQRALTYGFSAGFITGLGSTMADMMYAFVGLMGITMIEEFILRWQSEISIAGGIMIIVMGISVFLKKVVVKKEKNNLNRYPRMFLSSFLIAILNPATILSFMTVFAVFNIQANMPAINQVGFILGICIGTCTWWVGLSAIAVRIKKVMAAKVYKKMYQVTGIILMILGISVIVHGINN